MWRTYVAVPMPDHLTGCLYIPHFPAWAVARGRGVPVAVVASGKVIACSPKLFSAGVAPGKAADRVRALVPEARIVARDRALEQAVWECVLEELYALTPFIESHTSGLAFFRGDEEPARAMAARLRVQAAFAPARSFAHLAALRAAPGNTLVVTGRDLTGFLRQFEVDRLLELGFSEGMIELLRLFGYGTLGAVSTLSLHHIRGQFKEEGTRLHGLLHPEDEPPVGLFQPPATIHEAYDFEEAACEPGDVLPVLGELMQRAAARLGPLLCRRVRVTLEGTRGEEARSASRILPEASADEKRLLQTAKTLLMQALDGKEVTALKLELGALQPGVHRQQSLFRERPSIYEAVKRIHAKYPGAILRARLIPHALLEEDQGVWEPFPEEPPKRRRSRR